MPSAALIASVGLFVLATADVEASTLLTYGFANLSSTNVQVFAVDPTTGKESVIANTPAPAYGDLQAAYDGKRNILYWEGANSSFANGLYTTNLTTGTSSFVPGSFGNLLLDTGAPFGSVPEPSSWLLMLSGAASLCLYTLSRTRRRSTTTAALRNQRVA